MFLCIDLFLASFLSTENYYFTEIYQKNDCAHIDLPKTSVDIVVEEVIRKLCY